MNVKTINMGNKRFLGAPGGLTDSMASLWVLPNRFDSFIRKYNIRVNDWLHLCNPPPPCAWKGYLPANKERRELVLQRKREEYFGFIEQYYHSRTDEHHKDTYRQVCLQLKYRKWQAFELSSYRIMEASYFLLDPHWHPKNQPIDSFVPAAGGTRGKFVVGVGWCLFTLTFGNKAEVFSQFSELNSRFTDLFAAELFLCSVCISSLISTNTSARLKWRHMRLKALNRLR